MINKAVKIIEIIELRKSVRDSLNDVIIRSHVPSNSVFISIIDSVQASFWLSVAWPIYNAVKDSQAKEIIK
jgi:hypothetical protein